MKVEKYLLRSIGAIALLCFLIVCYGFYYTASTFNIPIKNLILSGGFPISIFTLALIILTSFLYYARILFVIIIAQLLWSAYNTYPLWEGFWVIKAMPNIVYINNFNKFIVGLEGLCIFAIWLLALIILLHKVIKWYLKK